MDNIQYEIKTEIGPLYMVASPKGLNGLYRQKQNAPMVKELDRTKPIERVLAKTAKQLDEYFSGKRKVFDIPFDLRGTSFQKLVWSQLLKIPFGATVAYRDIALRIKNPKAMRAVGSANGKNPICIIIPCHRVIAADGSLGGYSGGLSMKRKLLALERSAA